MTFAQWCGFLSLMVLAGLLWHIRQLLLLLFAAVVLANGLNHLAQFLQRYGLRRSQAVMGAIALFLGTLGLIGALIVPPFVYQFRELLTLVPASFAQTITWLRETLATIDPELTALLPTWSQLTQQIQPLLQQIAGQGLNLFYSTLGLPLSFLLLLVLSLMLLADSEAYRQGLIRCFPAFYRPRLQEILERCEQVLEDWLYLMVVSGVSLTLITWMGLTILQVRLPLALALLTGVMVLIPNIGLLISAIPAMAIALLDSPEKSMAVLILYGLAYYLNDRWLTPRWVHRSPTLLRGLLLLAQFFFATVLGLLGLVLAVPLTLVVQVVLQTVLIEDILDRPLPS